MKFPETWWFFAATLGPAFLISWLAGFAVRRHAPRFGLVDRPGGRKQHAEPTPLGGGLAVWLAVTAVFVGGAIALRLAMGSEAPPSWVPEFAQSHLPGLWERSSDLFVLLVGGTTLMLLGLADDRFGLPWQPRLGLAFLIAAICVATQGDDWQLTAFVPFRPVTWLLSVFWIVTLINAFNMLDNMDGLSAGVAAIAATMLAIFLLFPPAADPRGPQLFVGGFLLVLVGALLGFLWHNRTPSRLFLGDAGSYFVGFCIAVATMVATYTTYESPARHAVLAPLFVMAVPLYDLVTVISIRLREGRSPFQADRCHFSHRLVDLGFSKRKAVRTIYLTTATCALAALLLNQVDPSGAVVIALLVFCILWLIHLIESTARRKNSS
jgi:UDP-GlcNAc:undecaprenyl-phosphate/decaprenyl-phosphate GlcNAc-1-phosphate transferase